VSESEPETERKCGREMIDSRRESEYINQGQKFKKSQQLGFLVGRRSDKALARGSFYSILVNHAKNHEEKVFRCAICVCEKRRGKRWEAQRVRENVE
jgi:hypothetical protein